MVNEPVITLTLPVGAVNMVLAGLSELPFKHVANLCVEIKRQADEQMNPPGPKLVEDHAP